ncbi:MAG: hypothetical protein AB8G99_10315 [Planctomycetaceae bacterium]
MVRLRPFVGLTVACLCAWLWIDSSFAGRIDADTMADMPEDVALTQLESPQTEAAAPADVPLPTAAQSVPVEATAGISEISVQIASLSSDFMAGSLDCNTALAQVNQCVQTLDTQYLACETMPVWQDCRNQCVEFQASLPCCQETIISDVLIGEEIISEEIVAADPIPMDECCLPPAAACDFGGYGSCGGCGGGGGGGFGGGLLGTGLGAAALAVGLADDDSSSGGYDGT